MFTNRFMLPRGRCIRAAALPYIVLVCTSGGTSLLLYQGTDNLLLLLLLFFFFSFSFPFLSSFLTKPSSSPQLTFFPSFTRASPSYRSSTRLQRSLMCTMRFVRQLLWMCCKATTPQSSHMASIKSKANQSTIALAIQGCLTQDKPLWKHPLSASTLESAARCLNVCPFLNLC